MIATADLAVTPVLVDAESERALLGSLMLDAPGVLARVNGLRAEHFAEERHRRIYAGVSTLVAAEVAVDPLTLHRTLAADGRPVDVVYLGELSANAFTTSSATWHAEHITECARRRSLVDISDRLRRDAQDPSVPIANALAIAGAAIDVARPASRTATLLETRWDEGGDQAEETYLPFLGHDGVFIVGRTHLLASWWRLGKSELLARCTAAWLMLGHSVLWLSEESPLTWQIRLRELRAIYGVPAEARARLSVVHTLFGGTAPEFLERAVSGPEDVVIADTLAPAIGCVDEDKAAAVLQAAGPWVGRLPKARKTFLALTHHRKSEGEGGARIAGSQRLPTLFDVVLELTPDPEPMVHANRRHLTGRARGATPPQLVYELDDDGLMVVLGSHSQVAGQELDRLVVEALGGAGWLTTAEVRGRVGKASSSTVLRALLRLARQGHVLRDPPLDESAWRRTARWALREQGSLAVDAPDA